MTESPKWFQPKMAGQTSTKNINYGNGYALLEYECNGFWLDRTETDTAVWDVISLPGASNSRIPGAPSLPAETVLTALPSGDFSQVRIEIVQAIFKPIEGDFLIMPASAEERKADATPVSLYDMNNAIYSSDAPFPAEAAKLGSFCELSGQRVASAIIYPIRYYPLARRLEYLAKATVKIIYEEGPPMASTSGTFFSNALFRQIQGGENEFAREQPPLAGVSEKKVFLLVTSKTLAPSLQPLIDLRKKDFECHLLYIEDLSDDIDPLDVRIKKRIKELYAKFARNTPLAAILLGGDHTIVPAHVYKRELEVGSRTFLSDHFYAELDVSFYPIVPVGRLPASTPQQLDRMVKKILDYEQMAGAWQGRMWSAGYKEKKYDDQFIMPIKQINGWLEGRIGIEWAVFNISDALILNTAKEKFQASVNRGVAIINYNGHGQADAWQGSVTVEDLAHISPADGLPIVICSACNNGMIDDAGCFATSWMTSGKSIGVIAATNFSHVWINGEFDSSLIRAMSKGNLLLGEVLDWAKTETLKNNLDTPYDPNDRPLAIDNARMYLLLGDPLLKIKAVFTP